jgi:hypothetical protein
MPFCPWAFRCDGPTVNQTRIDRGYRATAPEGGPSPPFVPAGIATPKGFRLGSRGQRHAFVPAARRSLTLQSFSDERSAPQGGPGPNGSCRPRRGTRSPPGTRVFRSTVTVGFIPQCGTTACVPLGGTPNGQTSSSHTSRTRWLTLMTGMWPPDLAFFNRVMMVLSFFVLPQPEVLLDG